MNKYLLLRDNKQSGPYTVAELIDKGIKPYDLVWLDGKSAAWRYPSEIDELKAYAPAVEEQPYDRFYKKPEAEDEKKSAFQPTIVNEATQKKIDTPPNKVYINFPGQKKAVPVIQPIHSSLQEDARAKNEMVNKSGRTSWSAENTVADAHAGRQDNAVSTQTPDRRLFYAVIAACFVLMVIISILMINYGNQRSSIKQLNEMVQEMEKRQNEQNQSAKAALASRVVSAPVVDRTTDLPNTEGGQNQSVVPASPETGHHSVNALQKPQGTSVGVAAASLSPKHKPATAAAQLNSESSLQNTFAPAKAPADPATAASPSNNGSDSKENLFNLISVKPNNFKTGLFGGVVNLQLTLTNNSPHELQQVAIEVKYFSPEKKLVKTQTVFFKNVAPNSHSIIDVPKTNRGVTIDYAVTDIRN